MSQAQTTVSVARTAAPPLPTALERAFALQFKASRAEPYPSQGLRRDRLTRLIDLLCTHQDALCAAVAEDFGVRSALSSKLFDILPPVNALKYARAQLPKWMRPQRRGYPRLSSARSRCNARHRARSPIPRLNCASIV